MHWKLLGNTSVTLLAVLNKTCCCCTRAIEVLFMFWLSFTPYLAREIKATAVSHFNLWTLSKFNFLWSSLVLDILTNPGRVTLTHKKGIILGKNPLPILLFQYYPLKIKFVSFLQSWSATIQCKRKTIKGATKPPTKKEKKSKERERSK